MRVALERHSESVGSEAVQVEAEVTRGPSGVLSLRYLATGEVSGLRLPPLAASERTDDLWRHTCFEAFVRAPGGEGYYEFNFAPSTQWAAYRFDGYRSGMAPAEEVAQPDITRHVEGDRYALAVAVELGRLHGLPAAGTWRLGLSAVLEDVQGRISYWAAAHPAGKPDFHHPDSFALKLPLTDT